MNVPTVGYLLTQVRGGGLEMRKHRLMLDYDECSSEEVMADALRLREKYPELGMSVVEPSDREGCFHVSFPKSELEWEKALAIAEESGCDKAWLVYCKRYRCFAINTEVSKSLKIKKKIINPPVEKVESPFKLVVTPIDKFNLRCCLRLCESIPDKEWVWNYYTPAWDMITRIEIGCRDEPQAVRRLKWLSQRIKASFEVKKSG